MAADVKHIVIADDHAVVRMGISFLLQDMFEPLDITEVSSLANLLPVLGCKTIDLLLLDINIPGGNSVQMLQEVRSRNPLLPVLILSGYDESAYAAVFLQAGANGYVHKEAGEPELKKAIRMVLNGGLYTSQQVQKMLNQPSAPDDASTKNVLSPRETLIAKLLVQGMSSSEISVMLAISMPTVSTVKKRIFQKLKVRHLPQLIAKYQQEQKVRSGNLPL